MVISCSAPGCSAKKNGVGNKSLQFHRFPLRRPDVLQKWIKAMKCSNFEPTSSSYLCSSHFSKAHYEMKATNGGKHLKANAVPCYFGGKRPGRKKKLISKIESAETVKKLEESFKEEENSVEAIEQEFPVENEEKIESDLAQIISDSEKGTLQVLIVGEDGKITNSEYIFNKEALGDEDFKLEPDTLSEGNNLAKNEKSDRFKGKCKAIDSSQISPHDDSNSLSNTLGVEKLQANLTFYRKKIGLLQMKCKKIINQNRELKVLLKLLILKRGRGEKNLDQLLTEYERYECDNLKMKVKDEVFYVGE